MNVAEKIDTCNNMLRDLMKFWTRFNEILSEQQVAFKIHSVKHYPRPAVHTKIDLSWIDLSPEIDLSSL